MVSEWDGRQGESITLRFVVSPAYPVARSAQRVWPRNSSGSGEGGGGGFVVVAVTVVLCFQHEKLPCTKYIPGIYIYAWCGAEPLAGSLLCGYGVEDIPR